MLLFFLEALCPLLKLMKTEQAQGGLFSESGLLSSPAFYHPLPVPLFKKKKSFPLLNQSGKSLLPECTWAGPDRCVVSRKTGASFLGSVSVQLQTTGFRDEEVPGFMVVLLNRIVRLMGIRLLAEPLPREGFFLGGGLVCICVFVLRMLAGDC